MRLRIVTWNVRSLRDDRLAVSRQLKALAPDVVALQEAPRFLRSRTKIAALARRSGLLYVCGGASSAGTALLVSTRTNVLRSSVAMLPPTPQLHRRGVALVEIQGAASRPIVVASVHLGLSATERVAHAGFVNELLAAYDNDWSVVAGDLNETSGGQAWTALLQGRRDAGSDSDRPTFPGYQPTHRIDVVFTPSTWTTTCRVISGGDAVIGSDHLPVVVDVELGEPENPVEG